MTYVINNYDGTTLVSIADRTVNTTRTSIKLPGRDYPRYGEPVVEDLVWMLQHFAGAGSPQFPIPGQIWYDTNSQSIKVYNGSSWLGTGKTVMASSFPALGENGQVFYHTSKRQVFIYDSNNNPAWKLVGPIGAYDNSDPPNDPTPSYTAIEAAKISGKDVLNNDVIVSVIKVTVNGQLVAIVSKDASFQPVPAITGFANILPGINLNSTLSLNFNGNSASATTAANTSQLGGIAASNYMRKDQSNVPIGTSGTLDLGASGATYNNVYAVTFQGVATSARYADLAERYHADETVNPGQLVKIGGEHEITLTRKRGCEDVLGVASTNPAVMLNSEAGSDLTHPYVALAGRVPVRVIGAVTKGDRLMASSIAGVACAWEPSYGFLAIVGRSLENKTDVGLGTVEAIVGAK